jgi:hypothetical protein
MVERKQERLDAGFMSKHFPRVASIVINIMYKQKGERLIRRILNFSPDSYAFFKITCLSDNCVDGGFDLSQIINSMIRNNSKEAKGELGCDDSGPRTGHSEITYEVAIQYT